MKQATPSFGFVCTIILCAQAVHTILFNLGRYYGDVNDRGKYQGITLPSRVLKESFWMEG